MKAIKPMKAMILAAGEGKRMLPLTENLPKCLLRVGELTLLEHHILQLKKAGVAEMVINFARHGKLIRDTIGNGSRYDVSIEYSDEGEAPLETGGGVFNALPLLGEDPFITLNADVYTDYPIKKLFGALANTDWIHLVLVQTPAYRDHGDFSLEAGRLTNTPRLHTYSGIGVQSAKAFQQFEKHIPGKAFPLLPLFNFAIAAGKASAEFYDKLWIDVGTPDRLAKVNALINLTPPLG